MAGKPSSRLVEMSPEERRQVITLSPSIGKLTAVQHLVLYRSNLVRLPPEIATDVLPLPVNACSDACVEALPQGAERHVRIPHSGGRDFVQPEAYYRQHHLPPHRTQTDTKIKTGTSANSNHACRT